MSVLLEVSPLGIHFKKHRREGKFKRPDLHSNDYKCLALDNSLRIINHHPPPRTAPLTSASIKPISTPNRIHQGGRGRDACIMHESVYKTTMTHRQFSPIHLFTFPHDFFRKTEEKRSKYLHDDESKNSRKNVGFVSRRIFGAKCGNEFARPDLVRCSFTLIAVGAHQRNHLPNQP